MDCGQKLQNKSPWPELPAWRPRGLLGGLDGRVTAAPVPAIYHRDQRVSLDELRRRLAETKAGERSLIIKADKNTPYDLVVRITDEALKLGFSVVLATDSEQK